MTCTHNIGVYCMHTHYYQTRRCDLGSTIDGRFNPQRTVERHHVLSVWERKKYSHLDGKVSLRPDLPSPVRRQPVNYLHGKENVSVVTGVCDLDNVPASPTVVGNKHEPLPIAEELKMVLDWSWTGDPVSSSNRRLTRRSNCRHDTEIPQMNNSSNIRARIIILYAAKREAA